MLDDILSNPLAVEMRIHGLSNEEILHEIGDWAEMFELEALARRVRARELREMEIISTEVIQ